MSDVTKLNALIAAIGNMTAAYKTALETRVAPDSLLLEGKSLATIKSEISASYGADITAAVDAVAADLAAHVARTDNPHAVTKEQVGLGLVENFGIATTEEAVAGLAADKYITPALFKAALDNFWATQVGTAPETLDTINEIAAALNNDPDIVNTMTTMIGENAAKITALEGVVAGLETANTAEFAAVRSEFAAADATAAQALTDTAAAIRGEFAAADTAAATALATEAAAIRGEFAAADSALQTQIVANAGAIADLQAAVGEGSNFMETGVTDLALNPVNAGTPKSTYVAAATNEGTATLRVTMSTAEGGLVIEEDPELDGTFVPATVDSVEGAAIAASLQAISATPDVPYYITVTTSVKTLKEVVEDFETKHTATDARLTGEVQGLQGQVDGLQDQLDGQSSVIGNITTELGNKLNTADKASSAEVVAGVDDAKYVTSLGVKAAVDAGVGTAQQDIAALDTRVGAVELVAAANTQANTDLSAYVDDAFAQLAAKFDEAAASFAAPAV